MSQQRVNVVWFKCTDLRTHDHAALQAAHADKLPVLHLYVFDPFWYEGSTRLCRFPKTGVLRSRFQLEAVADLAERLAAEGHALTTRRHASTEAVFEELCADFKVNAVFAFHEICSEELRIQRSVEKALRRHGQGPLRLFWGFELYHHDDLRFDPKFPRGAFNSYTAFRKRVEESCQVRQPSPAPHFSGSPEHRVSWARADERLPTVRELMGAMYDAAEDAGERRDPRAEFRWVGGETAALARVREYLWETDSLGLDYVGATMTMDPSKSCMRDKAMTKLSPWLAHGCLSPRLLHAEVKRYERERRKTKSTYWITHELLWRDFVRFGSIAAGTSIFKIGGLSNTHPRWKWSTNREVLNAWMTGMTGFPFVDCFMRELKVTGYCNHMGRETIGWFLAGDLGLDWRMGAEWFESVLIDYEPTANWYNWVYRCLPAAGRPGPPGELLMDAPGHRLQGLEILKWGTQHDPDAEYIKRWIPALKPLPSVVAREPWRLGLHEDGGGPEAHGGELRPPPKGKFEVSRTKVAQLVAMGFDDAAGAVALYRAWGDVDAAVALLAEGDGAHAAGASDEDDDLARALQLSLEQPGQQAPSAPPGAPAPAGAAARGGGAGAFRYGEDYPKPLIAPVSLRGTEESEAAARQAQAQRDRQNLAARAHGSGRGAGSSQGGGKGPPKGCGGRGGEAGKGSCAGKRGHAEGPGKGERKRRWGAGQAPEDERVRGA
ncbi:unnamed protein product [Prorocentrum cordatum]|uniref:Cryptochrome DASH n=1 Tax=Prorocentrum cordatum TaxID=2364126 RepID=A0ABN9TP85_9DINO|nr:unnamed protein product [Polarella glacialis]